MAMGSQRSTGDLSHFGLANDAKALQRANELLQLELQEVREKLVVEKAGFEKQQSLYENSEKEKWMLRHEVANLKDEVHNYQQQLERYHSSSQEDHQSGVALDMVQEKNQQLQKLLQRNQVLENMVSILEERLNEMKQHMEDSVTEMMKTTAECLQLQDQLQESAATVRSLQHENQNLREKLQLLEEENEHMHQADEERIHLFHKRLENVKVLLDNKEQDLNHLRSSLAQTVKPEEVDCQEHVQPSILEFSEVIKEKEEYIRVLEDDRTKILEQMLAAGASSLQKANNRCDSCRENHHKFKEVQEQMQSMAKEMSRLKCLLANVEGQLSQKERQFTAVYARMRDYEQGEYGLAEAVAEIKEFRNLLRWRDRQIEELTKLVNVNELLKLDTSISQLISPGSGRTMEQEAKPVDKEGNQRLSSRMNALLISEKMKVGVSGEDVRHGTGRSVNGEDLVKTILLNKSVQTELEFIKKYAREN